MDDFIERLEDEIWQQTRNGRKEIYIEADDLRKLGYNIDNNKSGRTFIDLSILRQYIKRYQFKENLKFNGNTITYRQFMRELKELEKGNDDKCK